MKGLEVVSWLLVSRSDLDDDDYDGEASTERSVAAVSPIPKIVTTAIKEDEYRDEWGESEGQSESGGQLQYVSYA